MLYLVWIDFNTFIRVNPDKKLPRLPYRGSFLFGLPFDWTNYNLILYFRYVHVYISLLSTSKSSYDQPHM